MADLVLELDRSDITDPIGTPGGIFLPSGERVCHTIERPWEDGANSQVSHSAILPGTFELKFEFSPHFGRDLIHLQNVPGRDHIMIHPANWPSQLEGCIAPGLVPVKDGVQMSSVAVAKIEKLVSDTIDAGDRAYLKVSNG